MMLAGRETILCVDDEEGVLTALRLQLGQRFGHECEIATAASGKVATPTEIETSLLAIRPPKRCQTPRVSRSGLVVIVPPPCVWARTDRPGLAAAPARSR